MNTPSEFYVRKLPHWQPEHSILAVTARLHNSLPKSVIQSLIEQRELETLSIKNNIPKPQERSAAKKAMHQAFYEKYDALLDNPTSGPTWMKEPKVAEIIKGALNYFDETRYEIICYTIMSNHIHLIFHKLDRTLSKTMQSFKGYLGRTANDFLKRTGVPFWESESYDHWIRDEQELVFQINYVLNNPVKAGIVKRWEDFPHTYIREEFRKLIF